MPIHFSTSQKENKKLKRTDLGENVNNSLLMADIYLSRNGDCSTISVFIQTRNINYGWSLRLVLTRAVTCMLRPIRFNDLVSSPTTSSPTYTNSNQGKSKGRIKKSDGKPDHNGMMKNESGNWNSPHLRWRILLSI